MGCLSAAGRNVSEHVLALESNLRNCREVPTWLFKSKHSYPVFVCPEKALSEAGQRLLAKLGRNDGHELSRTAQLMFSAVAEALDRADLSVNHLKGKCLGIAIGTTVGCTFNNEDYYKTYRAGGRPEVKSVIDYLNGNLAGTLHAIFGTNGPSIVVTNACSSATDAIGLAGSWVAAGLCDIAIAGGADELSRIAYNGFVSLKLTDNKPCRPFDENRQGLNLGEGAGILILERQPEALKRGKLYGSLLGFGASSDAWHPTAPHPEGLGVVRAVRQAKLMAGKEISLATVNTHGTGTKSNDLAETRALAQIIGANEDLPIVSTKGWTGHTLGAAGAIEAILTLVSLNEGFSFGTLGCQTLDPDLPVKVDLENVQRPLTSKIGLSQSLAFGGCNSALILEGAK